MHSETTFVILFSIATAVAIAARRYRIPYTVALVLTGVVLGALHALEAPHLTKELLFAVFLPGLLFEAAFHIDFRSFWRDRVAISSLAVPGVIASIALTALLLTPIAGALDFVEGFTWRHALVFGALISATDPIAVVALFKSLGAPRRLALLVEGESLLNDGTAIVFFTLILGFVTGGEALGAGGLVLDFIRVVGGGALMGAAIGAAVSTAIQRIDDPMIEITPTTIAAYGSFVGAEQFHFSGVIATVVAGMMCGNYAARTGMSPATRVAVESFWEYVAFALNSIVFLLIGFEVSPSRLVASWLPILAAFVVVTLGRALVIAAVTGLLARGDDRIPRPWTAVLTWGGVRGGLSMVLVLGLARDFPHRDLLVTMTFGVVLLSILLQGLTMAPLLRRLGIVARHDAHVRYERARAELQTADAALHEVQVMGRSRLAHADVLGTLEREYTERVAAAENTIRELHLERQELREEELTRARRHLLLVEKQSVLDEMRRGTLSADAAEELLADVDARLVRLEEG